MLHRLRAYAERHPLQIQFWCVVFVTVLSPALVVLVAVYGKN